MGRLLAFHLYMTPVQSPVHTRPWSSALFVAVFGQVRQAKPAVFIIVGVNESFSVSPSAKARACAAAIHTSPRLHASSRLEARDTICWHPVFHATIQEFVSVWITPRKVEEIYACEYDEESAQQRYRVYSTSSIEAPE